MTSNDDTCPSCGHSWALHWMPHCVVCGCKQKPEEQPALFNSTEGRSVGRVGRIHMPRQSGPPRNSG